MEHATGTGKDLGLNSLSQGQPFQCLHRGMTCSELHFGKESQGGHVKNELQDTEQVQVSLQRGYHR